MDDSVSGVYRPNRTSRLARPLLMWRIQAGFPSPAEDYVEGRIDLNRDLIKHPLATLHPVAGDSMGAWIHPGALLVVDRMVETKDETSLSRASATSVRQKTSHRARRPHLVVL